MAYGLSVVNANSIVTIDEENSGFVVTQRTTHTIYGSPTATTVTFPNYGVVPFVFVRPLTYGRFVGISPMVANNLTTSQVCLTAPRGSASFSCEVAIVHPFINAVSGASSDHGLRVYNGSGSVIFDSSYQMPNIDLIDTTYQVDYYTHDQSWTAPSPAMGTRFVCLNYVDEAQEGEIWGGPPDEEYIVAYTVDMDFITLNSETSIRKLYQNLYYSASPPTTYMRGMGFTLLRSLIVSGYLP